MRKEKFDPMVIYNVLAIVSMAVVLHFMGRVFWCQCRYANLWISGTANQHTSQHLLDPYSFSHFQHGILFFGLLFLVRRPVLLFAILIEAAWEILENTPFVIDRYRSVTASLGYTGDSIANSLGDITACTLGFVTAKFLPTPVSIAIYFAVEIAMLLIIRDSLTLNVIMLVHPMDWIRDWQLGGGRLL